VTPGPRWGRLSGLDLGNYSQHILQLGKTTLLVFELKISHAA